MPVITLADFQRVDIRVGTIVSAEPFPEARKPAYRLQIDFGPMIGLKKSSAQITDYYSPESLLGQQVLAVVNFPSRQIGPMLSEVLVLGLSKDERDGGGIVLVAPGEDVSNGKRLH